MTKEFQDYCAELALRSNSTPSSAPCDTRIVHRPSTAASSTRTSIGVGTDPISRPTTAPSRPRNMVSSDLNKNINANIDQKNNRQNDTLKSGNDVKEKAVPDRPKTVTLHGGTQQSDSEQGDSDKRTPCNKQQVPKMVNQGIGSSGLQREFTLVEIPLGEKGRGDELKREKTYVTEKADLQVKRSEKNATMRKSRLDALLEQTVELVEDALMNEGKEPSTISETMTIKEKRPVPRSRSVDTRQRLVEKQAEQIPQRRKVDQARDKLRQHAKRRVERQENDARSRKPVRRMVWNQNPGQAYVRDLQQKGRQAYVENMQQRGRSGQKIQERERSGGQPKTRSEQSRDRRQVSSAPFIVPNESILKAQESSSIQRPRGISTMSYTDSIKELSKVRRSQSLTRERNAEARQRSSKSDRNQQAKSERTKHDSRVGSSASVKSDYSQDSEKSRPIVMMIEGDEPSAFQHLQLDMTRAARSIDIANSIDFSGGASKLRESPYLQNNPYVMGRPRKQRSASLNRSQKR